MVSLKGLMKQKTLGDSNLPMGRGSWDSKTMGTPPLAKGGLLSGPRSPKPSQSTEVQKMPNLMKRLTGK